MATVTIYTKAGAEALEKNPTHTHDYLTEAGLGDSVFNELQNRLQQGTGVTIDVDAENGTITLTATSAVGLAQTRIFKWDGEDYDEVPSEPVYIPENAILNLGPAATLYPNGGGTATTYTIERAATPAGPWVDLYGPTKPSIPSGQTYSVSPAPTMQLVPAGSWLRVRPISLPTTPAGGFGVATHEQATHYNSGANSLGTHPGPDRPSGSDGDIVVMFVSSNSPATISFGSGWGVVNSCVSDATTPRAKLTVTWAPWAADLDMGIGSAASSPLLATAVRIDGADLENPFADTSFPVGSNTGGTSINSPSGTATENADIVYYVSAFWYASGATGWMITPSGVSGLVETSDMITTRTSVANYGLWVGRLDAGVADGGAIGAVTETFVAGTGSTTNAANASAYLTIKRPAPGTAPTMFTVQTFITKGSDE